MKLRLLMVVFALLLCIVPAFAQDEDATHTLSYDDFSFTYDASVGANVNVLHFAGDDPAEAMPGGADAPYVQFLFYDAAPAPESLFELGGVRVYRVADTAAYEFVVPQINGLNMLLQARPDLAQYMVTTPDANNYVLPFLPNMPAAQVIRARARYVELDGISGISYVTVYRQDASPFTADEFLYTFQGLSADGTYYVSAVFRVTASSFPAQIGADFNYDEFITGIQDYFAQSIATLNDAAPADFTPSLDTLDALIQSFAFASLTP